MKTLAVRYLRVGNVEPLSKEHLKEFLKQYQPTGIKDLLQMTACSTAAEKFLKADPDRFSEPGVYKITIGYDIKRPTKLIMQTSKVL